MVYMKNEIGIYLEIINFFESQGNDPRERLLFFIHLMDELESTCNKELITNALNLATNFLTGGLAYELYAEESIEIHHLTKAQKKEVITILAKEIT